MKTIYFDIETCPIPEPELSALIPPFDPGQVKIGNLKDAEKIAAKRAEAEASHRCEFTERAALDPLTGRVLAIGLLSPEAEFHLIGHDDEVEIIREFWGVCCVGKSGINRMVGFNIHASTCRS